MYPRYASAQSLYPVESGDWVRFDAFHRLNTAERLDQEEARIKLNMSDRAKRFWKKTAPTMALLMVVFMITSITAVISYKNGYSKAAEELTEQYEAEYRSRMQAYMDAQSAKSLVSGEASRKAAIEADAKILARVGQGVMNTYKAATVEDARKIMICMLCRVYSGGEFAAIRSIEDAANQPLQWWGYTEGMSYTEEVYQAALEVSTIYHNGDPMPCSSDMVYASWNGTDIVLRNQWEANANARYW